MVICLLLSILVNIPNLLLELTKDLDESLDCYTMVPPVSNIYCTAEIWISKHRRVTIMYQVA